MGSFLEIIEVLLLGGFEEIDGTLEIMMASLGLMRVKRGKM